MHARGPVVTVVGNPSGSGRTGAAALVVADRIAALTGTDEQVVIDLSVDAEQLLRWGSPLAAAHKATVGGARALVVASPTYKATYTGLLKVFLDQFGAGELGGIAAVGVMTGGSAAHTLAVDVHLAPLLVEIGASLPARGLYLAGPEVDEPGPAIEAWWANARDPLARALGADPDPAG